MSEANSVKTILVELAQQFNADRIVVASIHSTCVEDLGAYNKVFSVVFEHSNDTFSISSVIKNIPISVLERELAFYKDNILVVSKNSSFPKKCISHLTNINAEVLINCHIKIDKLIIGVLSLQYTKAKHIKQYNDLTVEDINQIKHASDLSIVLT